MDPSTQAVYDSATKAADSAAASIGETYTPGVGPSALLVTSSPARTATADNVSKLNSIVSPNGSYQYKTAEGNTVSIGDPTINKDNLKGATFVTGPTGKETDPLGGSTKTTATEDPNASALSGIKDPAVKSQFQSSLQGLDTAITNAQSRIDEVKSRSLNDPAAQSMIAGIKAKYEQQITLMKARNTQILGKASSAVGAFGGLGQMSQNFLNDEQDRADQRVADIQSREDAAINKAQIAYQTQNFKDLNSAMDSYDKANKEKLNALNDLLKESDKEVKQQQAQQKLEMAREKQTTTLDISKSSNLGTSIAKNITDSGVTDKKQIRDYIEGIAKEYGITNPDILESAVTKAQQTAQKASGTAANIADTIKNRDAGTKIKQQNANTASKRADLAAGKAPKGSGTDGTYKYKQEDLDSYNGFLNQGGKDSKGTVYKARGTDGYTDINAYVAALHDWTHNGGTPAGFAKKFPIKTNVNPTDYAKLPAAIKPTAAASSQYQLK